MAKHSRPGTVKPMHIEYVDDDKPAEAEVQLEQIDLKPPPAVESAVFKPAMWRFVDVEKNVRTITHDEAAELLVSSGCCNPSETAEMLGVEVLVVPGRGKLTRL
jgi:hypothetical protein